MMPRPKDLQKYGHQYWKVANVLITKAGAGYTLKLPDHTTAMNLRWDFYAFIRALKLESKRLKAATPPHVTEVLEVLRKHQICVSGNEVTFRPAGSSPMALVLGEAIEHSDTRSLGEMVDAFKEEPATPVLTVATAVPDPDLTAGAYDSIFEEGEEKNDKGVDTAD
ncbi:MAG: hypothetical protein ACYTEQ_22505 [Planctomycetota bacterium]|jgi:hypothetical protein